MPAGSYGNTTSKLGAPLIPSRIRKVLSTMAARQVRALLMGGQACVFYGAAEFSRDTDLLVLLGEGNLQRLSAALQDLEAQCIAVPPFTVGYLERGHAVHFRCQHPEAAGIRVDIMSKLRGVEAFEKLWERRTTLTDQEGTTYELLSLPDLVQAKKTQRNKDWPMLQRLLESHYLSHRNNSTEQKREFWLHELRTPELLVEATQTWPGLATLVAKERPLIHSAQSDRLADLDDALVAEERAERERDREYWRPLKAELEAIRHSGKKPTPPPDA